ncbi:MAG: chorismate-binding protein, partial [Ilumatobacteraceae bacterium]
MRAVCRRLGTNERMELEDVAGDAGFLFARNGIGVAGRGQSWRGPVDDAPAVLAAIEVDGPIGPVAIGALPFRPGQPGELTVPAVTIRHCVDGAAWIITIDGAKYHGDRQRAEEVTASAYSIRPVTPIDRYLTAVGAARRAVRDGRLTKAVIAREIVVEADQPIGRHGVLRRLRGSFGSSYRFAVDGFIGASPELLVEVEGRVIRSHPLAGTASRTGDVDLDAAIAAELVASTKDQVEHRVVIDMIHDTLLPWCSFLDWEPDPSIVTVANVQHLGTRLEGRLSTP